MTLPVSTEKRVYDNVLGAMGNTPLVRLARIGRDLPVPLYAKLEFMNPGGSVKDRVGAFIIEQAEKRGELKPGGTIVEATSGNTGVGLAIAAALKGYKTIFVMPDKMSNEKILLLRAYGAKVVITPTAVAPHDPQSYYQVANKFARETPNAILANQYHNPDNPLTHEMTTGPELWEQTEGLITHFVCGVGTGGTISGTGRYLKEKNPRIRIHDQAIYDVVLREVAVGRPVWESHRLLDGMEEPEEPSFVDQFIKDRTSQGLAHVFTLLSLVQPAEPLQIAYRGLLTGDENLRGTALEYLEGTLPPAIRARLWPFLEDRRGPNRAARPRDEILRDLLRSHPSIQLKLEEVRQQTRRTHSEPWPTT